MLLICTPDISVSGSFSETFTPVIKVGGSVTERVSAQVVTGGSLEERCSVPVSIGGSAEEIIGVSVTLGGAIILELAPDAALAAIFTALVMNAKTAGIGLYADFPLTSIFKLGLEYYGITADGLVHLSGNTDNGAQIDALIISGVSDLGAVEEKNVSEAYLTMRCEGELEFAVTYNERKRVCKRGSTGKRGLSDIRFPLPLGAAGNQVQIAVKNVDGADFDFKKADITVVKRDRRR